MDEREDVGVASGSALASSSRPTPISKRPTVIKPTPKRPTECPPRPDSRPQSVGGSISGGQLSIKKLEITFVEAKPRSELELKDMTDSAVNLPDCPDGAPVKEWQGGSPRKDLPAEGAQDDDDNEKLRKPLRPIRPTIIRPRTKIQPTAQKSDTEATASPVLLPQTNQRPSLSSLPILSPPVSVHTFPSPKPRSRDLFSAPTDPQEQIHFAAEEKQFSTSPTLARSDLSISRKGNLQKLSTQPLGIQSNLAVASSNPCPNPLSSTTSSTPLQTPKRPSNPPHSILLGNNKDKSELHVNAKPEIKAEGQLSQVQLKHNSRVAHNESETSEPKCLQNIKLLPKPKPRPITLTSPGFKEEIERTPLVSENSSVNKQPSNQSVTQDTQQETKDENIILSGLHPLTELKNTEIPAPQRPSCHGNPPPRPTTATPVRKSTTFGDKHSLPSDYAASSSGVEIEDNSSSVGLSQASADTSHHKTTEAHPLPCRPGPGHPLYSYMCRQPHGIALHDYTASRPDELSFSEGDIVILMEEIDEKWTVGRLGDTVGLYPAAFVEVKYPKNTEKWPDSTASMNSWSVSSDKKHFADITGPRCRARFDFDGEGEGELTLQDGDVIQMVERVGTEWVRGQHRGRQGIFPSSFVEIIEDFPANSRSLEEDVSSNQVSALFDFDGKDGEISFKAEDRITVISQMDLDWLFGECNGQKGHFPASFVSNIPPNLPKYKKNNFTQGQPQEMQKVEPKVSSSLDEQFWESREAALGFCRAICDYLDPSPGDLEFRQGDRIKILEFIGEDWARGRHGNKEGLIPLRFVAEEINSPPHSPEPEVIQKVFGKVLHDFDGETVDDLKIKEGDIIEVQDFADVNKNWRWGILNGERGMFPADFVHVMECVEVPGHMNNGQLAKQTFG